LATNEKYVTVDSLKIRYLVEGTGPAIILVHGLGEFLESWLSNIATLSEYFTVYAIDLPGHGLSEESTNNHSISSNAKFIINFMSTMGISHASLLGHSMGGPICLSLAADFPGKVDKLVLVDSGGFYNKVSINYRLATIPFLGKILLGSPFLINKVTIRFGMGRQFHNPETVPVEWIDAANKHLKRPNRNDMMLNIIKNYTGIGSIHPEASITDKLAQVKQPTLIIHGMQDKVIPVEHIYNAHNLIPRAKLEIFDRCGHNPQIEKAAEFNEAVLAFLRSTEYSQGCQESS
jgi:4,5:9,10-diseco-3-hydroxy-5,9,17-trioxoandrosta-1(10),2-diene-4-oate hydrolase